MLNDFKRLSGIVPMTSNLLRGTPIRRAPKRYPKILVTGMHLVPRHLYQLMIAPGTDKSFSFVFHDTYYTELTLHVNLFTPSLPPLESNSSPIQGPEIPNESKTRPEYPLPSQSQSK